MISNPGRNGVALLGMLFVVSRLYGYADQITLGAYGYELWLVLFFHRCDIWSKRCFTGFVLVVFAATSWLQQAF
jgi:hypothetical protein